jgi:dolichyl-phosphate-mannose--protein O-mannosyl transferase
VSGYSDFQNLTALCEYILTERGHIFKLGRSSFDEVHFGKFASKYIKSQYFVDVHPPLAKLLITLAGFVFGYNGHFDFKDIGKSVHMFPLTYTSLIFQILQNV